MAVTKRPTPFLLGLLLLLWASAPFAAVLPEDRADALYHTYDGGGVKVKGPSILVRKGFAEKVSVYANYYQDVISSASIDVISYGSPYREERNEYSVGGDYLYEKTLLSLGVTNSKESDFVADTVSFGISQDFFGDMTTLAMGYSQGDDTVYRNGDPSFEREAKRRRYSLGLSQTLTKSWIMALNVESAVDDGYLQNPYRQAQIYDDSTGTAFRREVNENYPDTRNSDAVALRTMYYLPYRASVKFEARVFTDSWGIESKNYEVKYTHPVRDNILLEVKARTYHQTQADFYSDLYDNANRDYLGRDKELSQYSTLNLGMGVTYTFDFKIPYTKEWRLSAYGDFFRFEYDNFTDQCRSTQDYCGTKPDTPADFAVGEEPSYAFDAYVWRIFLTVAY